MPYSLLTIDYWQKELVKLLPLRQDKNILDNTRAVLSQLSHTQFYSSGCSKTICAFWKGDAVNAILNT